MTTPFLEDARSWVYQRAASIWYELGNRGARSRELAALSSWKLVLLAGIYIGR